MHIKMWRWLMVIMIPLLIGGKLSAQEAPPTVEYRLRVPTVKEFIEAIPSMMDFGFRVRGLEQASYPSRLRSLLMDEFDYRYRDEANAAILSELYTHLDVSFVFVSYLLYQPSIDLIEWNMEIVQRAFAEKSIQLPDAGVIQFGRYEITVKKFDFDADGEYEWMLYISHRTGMGFSDYWIAREDTETESGYAFTKVPIPYTSGGFSPTEENSSWAQLETPYLRDVTGDGIVEWITTTRTIEPRSGPRGMHYNYYVLGWRNNQWDIISMREIDGEVQPASIRMFIHFDETDSWWRFENRDDDDALELVEYQTPYDVIFAGCSRSSVRVHDWDGTYYVPTSRTHSIPFSTGCIASISFDISYEARNLLSQFRHTINQMLISNETSQPQPRERTVEEDLYASIRLVYRAWETLDLEQAERGLYDLVTDTRYQGLDASYQIAFAQYYYAMILHELGRDDEALAQYMAIYESAPDSAMGILARLHFEEVQ